MKDVLERLATDAETMAEYYTKKGNHRAGLLRAFARTMRRWVEEYDA
jgi:hypothetical protein